MINTYPLIKKFAFVGLGLFAVLALLISASVRTKAAPNPAAVMTDKHMYHAGEIMVITGTGFLPTTAITLTVERPDKVVDNITGVSSDANGGFTANYVAPGLNGAYRITATDGTNIADTHAADPTITPSVDLYSQCANDDGDGYAGADLGCHWTNGDLNSSNSTYHEDDATVQRLAIDDATDGDHTVIIKYSTTKGGKHSYDFMTNDNYSELSPNPLSPSDLCDPAITHLATCADLPPVLSGLIPTDTLANSHDVDRNARHFTIRNGTWTNTSSLTSCGQNGNSQCTDGFIAGPKLISGTYASDSDTILTLKFHVDTSTCVDGYLKQGTPVCEVLITWGAHVSSQADWGPGNSAVNIKGSPYHVQIADVDGDSTVGGGLDNQMSAGAIVQTGSITIIKDAVPNDAQDFGFSTTGGLTPSTFSLDDDSDATLTNTQTFSGLAAGTYTITEAAQTGWSLTGNITCTDPTTNSSINLGTRTATIDLAAGEAVTCTFVNTLQQGTLIVKKHVINDNGGTKVAVDFNLHVKSGASDVTGSPAAGSESGVSYTLNAGVYNVSEDAPPIGYSNVTNDTTNLDCDASGNVTVVAGQTKTCVITNDDIAPALHLRKVVTNNNGGTAVATDWTLTANGAGSNDLSGTTPVDSGPTLQADTFALSESGPTGYSASSWVCVGGTQNGSNITLGIGQSSTCTITNDDIAPTLKLVKQVTNDNGGTNNAAAWTLTATGSGGFSYAGDTNTFQTVIAGVSYALSESVVSNYTAGSWSCDGGNQNGSNITLGLDQHVTCTITNDDDAPHLHLRKTVTNDNGGTAVATDWTLSATGANASPTNLSGSTPVDSSVTFKADIYALGETGPAGYTAGAWNCVGGSMQDATHVIVPFGGDVTCTINNNDNPPVLHLRKIVVNDNGGTATTDDFTLTADGSGSNDLTGKHPVDSDLTLQADTFALSETNLAGYTASEWSCDGGQQSGSNITLGIGQETTCTITNDDQQAYVTVVKVVHNDHGGSAQPDDFNLTLEGNAVSSGVAVPVDPGTYKAGETQLSGYTFNDFSDDCDDNGDVTVALGESKTCTLTNSDQPAHLTLVKIVTNDNGGTAAETDFTLSANGPTPISGAGGADSDVNTGSYDLSESSINGYTASNWVCVGGTQNGSSVSLDLDQSATCTITNDDEAPALHLRKVVVNDNGGIATETEWTLSADGTDANDLSGTTPVDSDSSLKADTFALGESDGPSGYSASAWSCDGGQQSGSNITLGIGQEATCTITNDDIAPTLTIVKDADPNDCQDFTFSITGQSNFLLDDNEGVVACQDTDRPQSQTFTNLSANTNITVSETLPNAFWQFVRVSCVLTGTETAYSSTGVTNGLTVNLGLAKDVTCTFVNHKTSPTRTLGFWQTHTAYTISIFNTPPHTYPWFNPTHITVGIGSGSQDPIDTTGKLFGGFFANIAKTTANKQRTAIDKARMQLAQQLLAAQLNCAAFGCSSTIQTLISTANGHYAAGTAAQILSDASQLDAFNNSGDTIVIGNAGSATPQTSKLQADLLFWDAP